MRIRPYIYGIKDGLSSPYDLSSGITWENDQSANEAYDAGANVGQLIGKVISETRQYYAQFDNASHFVKSHLP